MQKTLKSCIANGTAKEWLTIIDADGTHNVYSCTARKCRHMGWHVGTDFCGEKLKVEQLEKMLMKPI